MTKNELIDHLVNLGFHRQDKSHGRCLLTSETEQYSFRGGDYVIKRVFQDRVIAWTYWAVCKNLMFNAFNEVEGWNRID